jgi:hypothetical protein
LQESKIPVAAHLAQPWNTPHPSKGGEVPLASVGAVEEILDALRAHQVLVDKPAEFQKIGFGLADTISI